MNIGYQLSLGFDFFKIGIAIEIDSDPDYVNNRFPEAIDLLSTWGLSRYDIKRAHPDR